MKSTRIVTSFLTQDGKYLILKRSNNVRSMKDLWAGISGIIEGNEDPLYRAKKEIHEETSITENQITLIRAASQMRTDSPQYDNHEWLIFPFLFSVKEPKIKLNWENSEYQWITPEELVKFQTVPSLEKVLASLL
ncbi:MAG TPA: NUDIX domain-containing protein [Candidatus Nitrosotalea sp.]|nr:NUDIX domain-containing protein [Candidatus Nitrosotalea sp.]HET7337001.1 NUDIX domain-containing protein [Candidatus Nitrosotalea sp.]HZS74410.1 NUDIX domain-containing protein [Candidatus Nitrosotalea sp.]